MADIQFSDVFGFLRPSVDVHTLGISAVSELLKLCGYRSVIAGSEVAHAADRAGKLGNISLISRWIREEGITRVGFSYRLDPQDAQLAFGQIYYQIREQQLLATDGGPVKQVYFAGLPEACRLIELEYRGAVPVFSGDETSIETLLKLGVPQNRIPPLITAGSMYDEERLRFGRELIASGSYHSVSPNPLPGYPGFGASTDTLSARLDHHRKNNFPPLMRVHVGPYHPDYMAARKEFLSWLRSLSEGGLLDIVSIGTSQLSQSDFGTEWGDKPNGGGVPVNSEQDFRDIWEASRPMLVRTYAGTRNIPALAEIYERTIHIAWHALSFWWFNRIDGRGPHTVLENLREHIETLRVIASHGKPFEPNIPHHFSFRGGDDVTYVLSALLAAKTAKKNGVRHLVLQTMLNTPKYIWGIQDLARARALLRLVRELEDDTFRVYLQPRAGLDYFSPDLDKARVQLAAVTAMMDDIEPDNPNSPGIIHVVSYCEAVQLATPDYIHESIRITREALTEYRKLKAAGNTDDMIRNAEAEERTRVLADDVGAIAALIEKEIQDPYTPQGLHEIFRLGIMPVPYLWEGREEFAEAVRWKTGFVNGGIQVVDEKGIPINPTDRIRKILSA